MMNEKTPTRVGEYPNYRAIYPIANGNDIVEPPPYTREETVLLNSCDVELIQEQTNENLRFDRSLMLKQVPKPIIIYASSIFPLDNERNSCTSEEYIIPDCLDSVGIGTTTKNNYNNQKSTSSLSKLNVVLSNKQIKVNQVANNIESCDCLEENERRSQSPQTMLYNSSNVPANQIIKAIENQNATVNKVTITADHCGINNSLTQEKNNSEVKLITKLNENLEIIKEVPNKKFKISINKNGKNISSYIPSVKIYEVPTAVESNNTLVEKNNKTLNAVISYCGICDETFEIFLSRSRCQICKTKLQYQCRKCTRRYATWSKIITHINTPCPPQTLSRRAKIYNCQYCSYTSICHALMKEHITNKHIQQKLYCQRCRKSFINNITGRELAKMHMINCTVGFLKCKYCPHKLENKWDIEKHIEFFHKNEFKPKDLKDIIDKIVKESSGNNLRYSPEKKC